MTTCTQYPHLPTSRLHHTEPTGSWLAPGATEATATHGHPHKEHGRFLCAAPTV